MTIPSSRTLQQAQVRGLAGRVLYGGAPERRLKIADAQGKP
jgi:hypothetical protein